MKQVVEIPGPYENTFWIVDGVYGLVGLIYSEFDGYGIVQKLLIKGPIDKEKYSVRITDVNPKLTCEDMKFFRKLCVGLIKYLRQEKVYLYN